MARWSVFVDIRDFLEESTRIGWRSLVIYLGGLKDLIKFLSEVSVKPSLCIVRDRIDSLDCVETRLYRETHRLLGSEYDNVLFTLENTMGWPGNLLALSFEFVKRGGFYILHIPPSHYDRSFTKYFLGVVKSECNVAIVDGDHVEYVSVCREKPVEPPRPKPRSSDKLIRRLEKLCVNEDQARVIRGYPGFLYGRDKLFLIQGDRGRGKSSVMGLLAAYTMVRGRGRFIVTSRSLYGVQSFYRLLVKGLETLGEKPFVEKNSKGLVYRVSIKGSTIEYVEPWRITSAEQPLFIDEAAGVGVARVRRWYNRVGKLVASTTIHGYEGSGRVLLKIVREFFHRTQVYRLVNPVRYYPGDPLERILYRVFHLDAEPLEKNKVIEPLSYRVYRSNDLAKDYDLLRRVYGLLVTAHYRNEPDDLILLLDTNLFDIYVVYDGEGDVVAVAQTRPEEVISTNPEKLVDKGFRLVDKFARYALLDEMIGKKILRIVRIAVTPPLQRKGVGSKLLKYIEEQARSKGYDGVGAIFSGFDTIRFWIKNNYIPLYISPRYNRVTGEKNVIVVKPLSREFKEIIGKATKMFYHYLWRISHILYRDLGMEKLSIIIEYLYSRGYYGSYDKKYDYIRLEKTLKNELPVDTVLDILLSNIDKIDLEKLDHIERQVFISRVLQGKTIVELARVLRRKPKEIALIYERALKKIIKELYSEIKLKN